MIASLKDFGGGRGLPKRQAQAVEVGDRHPSGEGIWPQEVGVEGECVFVGDRYELYRRVVVQSIAIGEEVVGVDRYPMDWLLCLEDHGIRLGRTVPFLAYRFPGARLRLDCHRLDRSTVAAYLNFGPIARLSSLAGSDLN